MGAMKDYLKKHWVKITIITLIFIISMGRFQYKMPKRQFADFHVSYYTGQKMLKGENVYDDNAYRKDKVANFKYPPLFASITALFALTSERIAATTWFTFNFLLIILFMFFSGRMIFNEGLTSRQRNWIYFLSLFFTSRFYFQNFDEGQVNFLMMISILLGLYAAQRNKNFLSGLLIGFSILVKYMAVLFIPYLLIKRRFKVVLYIGLSLLIYTLIPALFWGWERNISLQSEYIPFVCKTSLDMHSLSDYANQSLMAMIVRFFSGYGQYGSNLLSLNDFQLGFVVGSAYIFFYLFSVWQNYNPKALLSKSIFSAIDIALIFVCVALFNPNAWMHAFIFLTFGYMVIFRYLFKNKLKDKVVLILTILSFVFHSLTSSFFTNFWNRRFFEIYSFVAIGAIFTLFALFKIKFQPRKNQNEKNNFLR